MNRGEPKIKAILLRLNEHCYETSYINDTSRINLKEIPKFTDTMKIKAKCGASGESFQLKLHYCNSKWYAASSKCSYAFLSCS